MDTLVATACGWPSNLAHLLARFIWLIPRSQEPGAGSQMTHASCLTAVSITPSVIVTVSADHVGITAAVSSGGSFAVGGVEVAAVQPGDAEGQVQGLAAVKSGIARGLVAVAEIAFGDVVPPADAFGDVISGEFDVDAARMSTQAAVHLEEAG